MPRVTLQSTVLQAVDYHSQLVLLDLEFRSGVVYRYFGVPAQTYAQFMLARSKGAYFNSHIRNRFAYAQAENVALPFASHHPTHHA